MVEKRILGKWNNEWWIDGGGSAEGKGKSTVVMEGGMKESVE